MKKLTLCSIVISTIFLSACADMMHAKNNNNNPAPPTPQSNAQRAENFSNAVQRCVGMGFSVGSPLYEACVKNQLK
jgi:PBP1b-binding outer membrane lipoprotein LpoB